MSGLLLCIDPCIPWTIGLRLITNRRRRPLLVAESAQAEEEGEEEEERVKVTKWSQWWSLDVLAKGGDGQLKCSNYYHIMIIMPYY